MKILALSPHPDDVEFGCGGFLAKHSRDEILIVYFSMCNESMTKFPKNTLHNEVSGANTVLLTDYKVLGFEVRRFNESRQDILEELVTLRNTFNPDLVLIPSVSDVHQDHTVIHEEAKRAFNYVNMLAYELPWNCRGFKPNYFVPLGEYAIEKKVDMIEAYKSQAWRHYANADFINSLAVVRGAQCNRGYAEAFETITWIT